MSSPGPPDVRSRAFGPALLVVLIVAKLSMVAGTVPLRAPQTWLALCWQDVATAIVASLTLWLVPHRWLASTLYALLISYVALNVPIARVVGSPLTWTMWHAARGALGDSVRYHLTASNLAMLAGCAALGAVTPVLLPRWPHPRLAILAGLVIVIAGAVAAARVDTIGFDRNALTALLPRAWDRRDVSRSPRGHTIDRTRLGTDVPRGPDLSAYRGSARGMNVILVVLESTAAQYLAAYGAIDDPMPTLTALSEQALVAEAAYAAYPESVKGLYATLCGQHPRFALPAEAHASLRCPSVAASLQRAGYRTALFHSGRFGYLGMDALIRDKGFDLTEDAGAIGGQRESSFGVEEAATVARLLAWVDHDAGRGPFFAAYLPVAGHHPYASATVGPFETRTEFGRYRNALHDADRALGTLLEGLRARGLENRTALVIVGDHGEAFNQHPGNNGHTLFIHEENVRVPFLVFVPGLTAPGRRTSSIVSLVDVPATVRDLTGLGAADDEGLSLLSPEPRMAFFFTDYALGWMGIRDGCWKYILDVRADRSRLFDVCRDPGERDDRSASSPQLVARFRARIEALQPE